MSGSAPRSEDISPTAHYTGSVWASNDLSHPALVTTTGRVLFNALRPPMAVSKAIGGPTLEGSLLARHRLIDELLETAIQDGSVSQVIEIAAGMSPRGWRFAQRHGDRVTYVEADLPHMAARKRRALERAGALSDHHRVVEIDALVEEGPVSLPALAAGLESQRGLAIVTEGLLNYLDQDALEGLWRRIADTLAGFRDGLYLSDLVAGEYAGPAVNAFFWTLSAFVRGRVRPHFETAAEAIAALRAAGFAYVTLHSPADAADRLGLERRSAELMRVIEASG